MTFKIKKHTEFKITPQINTAPKNKMTLKMKTIPKTRLISIVSKPILVVVVVVDIDVVFVKNMLGQKKFG